MNDNVISKATEHNWKRLGIDNNAKSVRLSKRANKRLSTKNIIPVEYLIEPSNKEFLYKIREYSDNSNINSIIYNLALNYLRKENLVEIINNHIHSNNKFLTKILNDFKHKINNSLLELKLPENEPDFLGVVYQSLLKEGHKNIKGSYYTPKYISEKIVSKLKGKEKFLDPCCGSGSFLLNAAEKIENPENLYGCDIDKTACFIAKINLILKYKDKEFAPNIFNTNFLTQRKYFKNIKFDIVATNPPWGAMHDKKYEKIYTEIKSKESFSYFINAINKILKPKGECYILLPQSILNIGTHKDIRKFIIDNFSILEIETMGKIFSGVFSKVVFMGLSKNKSNSILNIKTPNESFTLNYEIFKTNINYNFSIIKSEDVKILEKIFSQKYNTLSESQWALGIVTGNNTKYLLQKKVKNSQKIYTGKEISKYFLKDSNKYIIYDRGKYQQIADDKLYFAKEKLIYKFISKKLVFAYDNNLNLVLNSANILIPNVKYHSIKTVLAFLNSTLFQYIYSKKFGDLKILKSNLSLLPFPVISKKVKTDLENLVNEYIHIKDLSMLKKIDDIIYKCFNLNKTEINIIKKGII